MATESPGCGIGRWKPAFLQRFNNLRTFVSLLCAMTFIHGMETPYRAAILTTLQKRYGYTSSAYGFILSSTDMSYVPALVLLTYFGNRFSIPKVISLAGFGISVASILWTLPYFIFGKGHFSAHIQVETSVDGIIHVEDNSNITTSETSTLQLCTNSTAGYHSNQSSSPSCDEAVSVDEDMEYAVTTALFVISQLMMGVCLVPLVTLGISFIDKTVKQQGTSTYIGAVWGFFYLGAVAGYLLGAVFTSIYIDLSVSDVSPSDPHWLGAWWLGSLITMVCSFLLAWPIMLLPHTLTADMQQDTAEQQQHQYNLKSFPRVLWSLLTNPVYMGVIIGGVFVVYMMGPFTVFLPKYIETQFHQTASTANIVTALISGVASCMGLFIGGAVQTKLQLSMQGIIRILIIASTLCGGAMALLMAFGCDPQQLDGATNQHGRFDITTGCNQECSCSTYDFTPVCSGDTLYFTPCHAGCMDLHTEEYSASHFVYTNCSCTVDLLAIPGECPRQCLPTLVPYVIIAFILLFTTYCTQVTPVSVILQCVKEEERSLALGIHLAGFSLFAFVPGPPVLGAIIDTTCVYWQGGCEHGQCLHYDTERYRLLYHGVLAALQIGAILAFLISYSKAKMFRQAATPVQEEEEKLNATRDDINIIVNATHDDINTPGNATHDDINAPGNATHDDINTPGNATHDISTPGNATHVDINAPVNATHDDINAPVDDPDQKSAHANTDNIPRADAHIDDKNELHLETKTKLLNENQDENSND